MGALLEAVHLSPLLIGLITVAFFILIMAIAASADSGDEDFLDEFFQQKKPKK